MVMSYKDTADIIYDHLGLMLKAVDPNTNLQLAYDANGNLVRVKDKRLSKVMSYQYDGLGNRTKMKDGESIVTTYAYDLASRPISLIRSSQQFDWTYDNANRLTKLSFPSGTAAIYNYDASNHLLSLVNQKSDNSVISSFSYQYDSADNRTQLALADGSQINYGRDADDQLTSEIRTSTPPYNHQFSYDSVGNRIQLNANGAVTNYTYDGADELTQEAAGQVTTLYSYDGDGNRVLKNAAGVISTYSYDFNDRLAGFASTQSNAAYQLDALGRRASKTEGGVQTQFLYDGLDDIAEYDQNGVSQAQNVFGPGIDQNLARVVGGNAFFYLHDGTNSVRNIIDASQGVQNAYDYDAWGNILTKVEQVSNDFTFTGRRIDRESGLYDYRARMYDSQDGRFVQVDPMRCTR